MITAGHKGVNLFLVENFEEIQCKIDKNQPLIDKSSNLWVMSSFDTISQSIPRQDYDK